MARFRRSPKVAVIGEQDEMLELAKSRQVTIGFGNEPSLLSVSDQGPGGSGRGGFGPKARAVSRCGRFASEISR